MTGIYGWHGAGPRRAALPPPYTASAPPPLPDKVYSDKSPRCAGCQYLRHGLFCRGVGDESCLRGDMRELEEKWLAKRRGGKDGPNPVCAV